jgi:ankyrin repeat protein
MVGQSKNKFMFIATMKGEPERLQAAVNAGGDIHQIDLLIFAIRQGRDESCAKLLLELGIDPNQKDDKGESALYLAVEHHYIKTTTCLLEHGALLTSEDVGKIFNPRSAFSREQEAICYHLLKNHPECLQLSHEIGRAIIPILLNAKHLELLKLLTNHDDIMKSIDKFGNNILHYVGGNCIVEGADTYRGHDVTTSLRSSTNALKVLLSNGSSELLSQKNTQGQTPLDVANKYTTRRYGLLAKKQSEMKTHLVKAARDPAQETAPASPPLTPTPHSFFPAAEGAEAGGADGISEEVRCDQLRGELVRLTMHLSRDQLEQVLASVKLIPAKLIDP